MTPKGELVVSVPNLAHLQSRINFLVAGRLIRTASEIKHPGDRPLADYVRMAASAGLELVQRSGIFPTFPVVTPWIRRKPRARAWLHRLLTRPPRPWLVLPGHPAVPRRIRIRIPSHRLIVFQRLKQLFGNLVVYGLGDTATQIISVILLPIYARYLSTTDYGVLALLLTVEVVTKVIFRWGIDGAFMRLYYECHDRQDRQRLASTQFFFLLAANGALLTLGLIGTRWLGPYLFDTHQYDWTLRLVLINTFVVGFYYLPFHVMRMDGRTPTFVTLGFARSLATILMRLLLVIALQLGVHGVVLSDIAVTVVFTLLLVRWFAPLIRPVFSRQILRESLRFGLPRLPHGVAQQVIGTVDRPLLRQYVSLHEVGLYSTGSSFGQGLKLFLSSFEQAWAPFYYAVMREPDAKETFARVTTYGVLVLALLVAGLAACASDLIAVLMPPTFQPAARVVPWVGLGVALQGIYLLTSIGLNITKRTEYYPVATAIAAGTSVGANLLLIPTFGIIGAAWANVAAYAVLALVAARFSQRFYPIAYETARLVRIVTAAGDFVDRLPAARAVASPVAWPAGSRHCRGGRLWRGARRVTFLRPTRDRGSPPPRVSGATPKGRRASQRCHRAGGRDRHDADDRPCGRGRAVGQSLSGRRRRRGDIVARAPTTAARVRHVRMAVCDVQEFNARAVPAQVAPDPWPLGWPDAGASRRPGPASGWLQACRGAARALGGRGGSGRSPPTGGHGSRKANPNRH